MEPDDPTDELTACVRERLRISDLAHNDFTVKNDDVKQLLATVEHLRGREEDARRIIADGVVHVDELEAERLKAIIAELVEASENALHVLTPARPIMDGLDRTRMYLREAIARAKKA